MVSEKPKILAFAGSLRTDSFNKKVIKIAVKGAEESGALVTLIDLKDYQMPLYDGDNEAAIGLPENAKKLKKMFIAHDGFLLCCPEYNSSITAVLKNTIDWVSRPEPSDTEYLCAYKNKVAGLLSASPGNLGGLRGLVTVRSILENIGTIVLPTQKSLSKANEAFDENGNLRDEKDLKAILQIGRNLTEFLKNYKKKEVIKY